MVANPTGTSSDNPDPKRIKSSINIVPDQSRADSGHVLLSVVLNFGEFLQADVDTSGRRESGVCSVATALNLVEYRP